MTDRRHIFSPCRRFRYTLWREWSMPTGLPLGMEVDGQWAAVPLRPASDFVMWVGLNPSTADERQDDPTLRRCIDFAKSWGYGAMCMTNAFGFRQTDPEEMKREPQPTSHGRMSGLVQDPRKGFAVQLSDACANDFWLETVARHATLVVACWGADGRHLGRDEGLLRLLGSVGPVHCLGVNSDGTPKHPLYLPSITKPQLYQLNDQDRQAAEAAEKDHEAKRPKARADKPRPEPAAEGWLF